MNPGNEGPDACEVRYSRACSMSLNIFGSLLSRIEKQLVSERLISIACETCCVRAIGIRKPEPLRGDLLNMKADTYEFTYQVQCY